MRNSMRSRRMAGVAALAGAAVMMAGPVVAAPTDAAKVPFADRQVDTIDGKTAAYQVFVPKHWDASKKWPVILFLHGSGERGTDGKAETKNGVRLLIGQDMENFPCVVVCPQCQTGRNWTSADQEILALRALNDAMREFNGDSSRVYLTGLSMGGYGTWDLARRYPTKWAAIAPCCGGVRYPGRNEAMRQSTLPWEADPYTAEAQAVSKLPIWIFHGGSDPTVPVRESRQMNAALESIHADVKYNEYPGVGHNSWDNAYAESGLLPWLLSHKTNS